MPRAKTISTYFTLRSYITDHFTVSTVDSIRYFVTSTYIFTICMNITFKTSSNCIFFIVSGAIYAMVGILGVGGTSVPTSTGRSTVRFESTIMSLKWSASVVSVITFKSVFFR